MDKATIDLILGLFESIIKIVEGIDPNAANNKVVVDIQKAIAVIQGLGL
jgi:hypothetical protein